MRRQSGRRIDIRGAREMVSDMRSEWSRVKSEDMHGGQRKGCRIDDIVRGVYYNQLRRKVRSSGMVDPMVRGHATDMVDQEATVVRVERLCMLEVEDEVRRGHGGTRSITIAENLTFSPFLAYTDGCAFSGGGCREDFRLW